MRGRADTMDEPVGGTATRRGRCSCPASPRRRYAEEDSKGEWGKWLRHYVRVGITHSCPAVVKAILAWLRLPLVICSHCVAGVQSTITWILSWNPDLRQCGVKSTESEGDTPRGSSDSDAWDSLEAGGGKLSPSNLHHHLTVGQSLSPWSELSTTPRTGATVDATVWAACSPSGSPRPSPLNGTSQKLVLWGAPGSQCSICGYTLEEQKEVLTAPSCEEGIKFHTSCFHDSGLAFTSEDGSNIFGCDCGQFHSELDITEGIFAVRAGQLTPSESRASTPRASRSRRGSMTSPSASTLALESCPAFQQVLPSTLAVFDGFVQMRRAAVGTVEPSMSLRDLQLDPDSLAARLARQDVLSKAETSYLLEKGTLKLGAEDNLLELKGETIVVGDLHGQFFDLLNILQTYGQPPSQQYLFLGDYVDRGRFSCEVALYLLSLKISFPSSVYLIRGNHETANQTAACGFKKECCSKYGLETYEKFLECFSALPVSATLHQEGQDKSLFCVHGGISPRLGTLQDIRALNRRVEPVDGSLLADLLWSDPSDDEAVVQTKMVADSPEDSVMPEEGLVGFERNLVRGCSWSYDLDAANRFMEVNGCRGILRAHSVQGEGYYRHFKEAGSGSCETEGKAMSTSGEGVFTVFSAPKYVSHENRGGVLLVRGDGRVDTLTYDAAPEPEVSNRAQSAVRGACPYMPISLAEWAEREAEVIGMTAAMRGKPLAPGSFSDQEVLALRLLWEAMSDGGYITEQSLFSYDDTFGDGVDCLKAGSVLKALSNGQKRPAEAGDLLLLARALKASSGAV